MLSHRKEGQPLRHLYLFGSEGFLEGPKIYNTMVCTRWSKTYKI